MTIAERLRKLGVEGWLKGTPRRPAEGLPCQYDAGEWQHRWRQCCMSAGAIRRDYRRQSVNCVATWRPDQAAFWPALLLTSSCLFRRISSDDLP